MYFWEVLETIHKFIMKLHALEWLFLRGSNKQQRRGKIIPNFTKGQDFYLLLQPSALEGNLIVRSLFLHPTKRHSSSVWPRREYTWTLNWKGSLLICSEKCQCVPYSHGQSRNNMMNTFIIVNFIPACKR